MKVLRLILSRPLILCLSLALFFNPALTASAAGYRAHVLVSNLPGIGDHTDPDLLNAWGLVVAPGGDLIVADNHSNLATFYRPDGRRLPIAINADEAPTGLVMNRSWYDFIIGTGRNRAASVLLFSTEAGTILGWNPAVNNAAVIAVDNSSSGAVYKGIALGSRNGRRFIYATDFHNGKVDMFDGAFHMVGSFTDPTVDPGFAPFNVQNIRGTLWVTFALQKAPDNADDQSGPGNGFVDVFDLNGRMLSRFASHGALNSPWGMALAPRSFGKFANALLIGNFGDGTINAFNPGTGHFLGQLADANNVPIQINGLWALRFGRSAAGHDADGDEDDNTGRTNTLFFTAGPNEENDGLLGFIRPD